MPLVCELAVTQKQEYIYSHCLNSFYDAIPKAIHTRMYVPVLATKAVDFSIKMSIARRYTLTYCDIILIWDCHYYLGVGA